MKPIIIKEQTVVVSTFSGMDLFLLGCVKAGMIPVYAVEKNFHACLIHRANFLDGTNTPVMEPFVAITQDEYIYMKNHVDENGFKDLEDQVGIINGQHFRTRTIQEISGREIRNRIETEYGTKVKVVLIGGPPCQDYSKLNRKKRPVLTSRNFLVFEFLKFMKDLDPDVALMEEVPEFRQKGNEQFFQKFIEDAKKLPYHFADLVMNSIHYRGRQSRKRNLFEFVHHRLNKLPVFPEADAVNVIRAGDFLDLTHFHSGHFTDAIKTANHFMCTVTSGSPQYFYKNGIKRSPSLEELLLCMDVLKGDYTIPVGIPGDQIRKAIGNGVCVSVAYALASIVMKDIFGNDSDGGIGITINPSPIKPIIHVKPSEIKQSSKLPPPVTNFTPDADGKIINSAELQAMQFEYINFEGEWNYFFGFPALQFHCIIHGLSGHGKSTFAIQFAKYLADNFGRVLYISAEEGITMTFQHKFLLTSAISNNLDVVDLRSYDAIFRKVPRDTYRFIFIDSLDTLKIDTVKMKRIRATYKNSALITISQSTKKGEMRGSYELMHDSDIAVRVEDGIAETTKNRFQARGRTLRVFGSSDISESKPTEVKPKTKGEIIKHLQEQLAAAIEAENYELAAKLRDELNKLQPNGDAENNQGS